jgi:hypothetical protein
VTVRHEEGEMNVPVIAQVLWLRRTLRRPER